MDLEKSLKKIFSFSEVKTEFLKTREMVRAAYKNAQLTSAQNTAEVVHAIRNIPKTTVNIPKVVSITKPSWIDEITNIAPIFASIKNVHDTLSEIKKAISGITLPKGAKDPIAVRLSDGEEFYKAVANITTQGNIGGLGGSGTPKIRVTVDGQKIEAVPVVNPDGTTISGGGGGGGLTDAELRATPVPVSVTGGGDASAANQTSQIALETSIKNAVETIDNAISGSEMQVDVLSVIPGTGATNLGKQVDSAAGGTDSGVATLAVRNDTLTTLTPADGDYTNLRVGSKGELWVTLATALTSVSDSIAAVQSGTWTVQPGNTANTTAWKVDGSAVTQPVSAASLPLPSGAATSALQTQPGVDIGDVTVNNAAGASAVNIQDGGNTITVDGTVSANATLTAETTKVIGTVRIASGGVASGSFASGSIASGAIASGAIAAGAIAAGATSIAENEDAVHTTGDRGVKVWGTANEANTVRAADNDYVPFATDTEGNTRIVGNRDADAVDAGEPVKVGGQARTTNPTAVADADRTNFIADKLGKQVVVGSIRDLKGNQQTTITSSTAETTIVTAIASTFNDLYGLVIANTSATACNVTIKDNTAGTTRFVFAVPAGDTRGFMLPESAAHKQGTVNNTWTATCSASVASISITALYVQNT